MKKTLMMLWMAVSLMVSLVGCSSEEMDYENPDVTVFVKQLKAGTYNMKNEKGVVEVPHFTEKGHSRTIEICGRSDYYSFFPVSLQYE